MRVGFLQLVFVMLLLGLAGSSYWFVFKPAADRRATRQVEMENKKKALGNLRQSTQGISDLEKKISDLQEAIKFFESKLPQEREIDTVLKEVWQMAEQNNLQTRTIKTQKSEKNAGFSELPIEMSLAGDFRGFYSFLLQLEKLSRITRIGQMRLEKISERDGDMVAKMTLSVFFESGENRQVAGAH
jgi:type IV pilus assembly protein PilO